MAVNEERSQEFYTKVVQVELLKDLKQNESKTNVNMIRFIDYLKNYNLLPNDIKSNVDDIHKHIQKLTEKDYKELLTQAMASEMRNVIKEFENDLNNSTINPQTAYDIEIIFDDLFIKYDKLMCKSKENESDIENIDTEIFTRYLRASKKNIDGYLKEYIEKNVEIKLPNQKFYSEGEVESSRVLIKAILGNNFTEDMKNVDEKCKELVLKTIKANRKPKIGYFMLQAFENPVEFINSRVMSHQYGEIVDYLPEFQKVLLAGYVNAKPKCKNREEAEKLIGALTTFANIKNNFAEKSI